MGTGHHLDIESWNRRAQYEFFRDYDLPFFNLCAEVSVGATRTWCSDNDQSFSLACWFACQQAVNEVQQFRYRLRDRQVWVHDRLEVATTILNADETFRFCYLPFGESFEAFCTTAREAMAMAPDGMDDRPTHDAVIHGSTLPWLRFTSVSHPRRLRADDAVPKITFGRATELATDTVMPVSVEVHHALMDGIHACRFFEVFEGALSRPGEVFARKVST